MSPMSKMFSPSMTDDPIGSPEEIVSTVEHGWELDVLSQQGYDSSCVSRIVQEQDGVSTRIYRI